MSIQIFSLSNEILYFVLARNVFTISCHASAWLKNIYNLNQLDHFIPFFVKKMLKGRWK